MEEQTPDRRTHREGDSPRAEVNRRSCLGEVGGNGGDREKWRARIGRWTANRTLKSKGWCRVGREKAGGSQCRVREPRAMVGVVPGRDGDRGDRR